MTKIYASFEAFTEVMIQVVIFRVMTPCSVVVGYQHFRGPCCLHLLREVTTIGKNGINIVPDRRGLVGAASQ